MSKLTVLEIIKSVFAALIGVQSDKNRVRDFQYGSGPVFVVAGLIAVILFVLLLAFIVSLVVG